MASQLLEATTVLSHCALAPLERQVPRESCKLLSDAVFGYPTARRQVYVTLNVIDNLTAAERSMQVHRFSKMLQVRERWS